MKLAGSIFICLITLHSCGSVAAQNKLDSLWAVWSNVSLPDEDRLTAIGDYAWIGHVKSNPDSAFYYAQMQYDFAEKNGNVKQMAVALGTQGASYVQRSDFSEAIRYYEQSVTVWVKLNNSEWTAHAISNVANTYMLNGNYEQALHHYGSTMPLWEEACRQRYEAITWDKMGVICMNQGNYPLAIEYFTKAIKIQEDIDDKQAAAVTFNNLGIINSHLKDYRNALHNYQQSLRLKEELGQKVGVANTLGNIGMLYFHQKEYDHALDNFERSLVMLEAANNTSGMAACLNNIGMVHHIRQNDGLAYDCHMRSLALYETLSDRKGVANALINIAVAQRKLGKNTDATGNAERALTIARNIGLVAEMKNSSNVLYTLYKDNGNNNKALEMYELYVSLRDSLLSEENQKKVMRQQFQYDYEKKENAIQKEMALSALKFEYEKKQVAARTDKEKQQLRFEEELKRTLIEADFTRKQAAIEAEQKQKDTLARIEQDKKDLLAREQIRRKDFQRNASIGGFALMVLLAGVFFAQRNRISNEKARSEALLLNILPQETADELKQKGKADARLYNEATVLFTDFQGFTALSEQLTPQELVEVIDIYFKAFDRIIKTNGIEKIKTIGDAYMAAGGLPAQNSTHAVDCVRAAIQMRDATDKIGRELEQGGKAAFKIRIGIHTGPVIAGVVGEHKFQYDIWGDTVNTASRMESSGVVGKVNISQSTYELVKEKFAFTYRGEVEAKGKGKLGMYFVEVS
jgi:adenylate cyclase